MRDSERKRKEENPEEFKKAKSLARKRNYSKHGHKYKRSTAYYRNLRLIREYGITTEQRDKLLSDQEGKCLICGTSEPPRPHINSDGWQVDHCHRYEKETGGIKIRGILCVSCNSMLGMAKDRPEVLISAAQYLLKHT